MQSHYFLVLCQFKKSHRYGLKKECIQMYQVELVEAY